MAGQFGRVDIDGRLIGRDWISHDGGPMPVGEHTIIEVLLRVKNGYRIGERPAEAARYHWRIPVHLSGAVIAYRPSHPGPPS